MSRQGEARRQRYQFTQADKDALNLVADECSRLGVVTRYLDGVISNKLGDPRPWVEGSSGHWTDAAIKLKSFTGNAPLDPSSVPPGDYVDDIDRILHPTHVTERILNSLQPVVDRTDPRHFWFQESEVRTLSLGILSIAQGTLDIPDYRRMIGLSDVDVHDCRGQAFAAMNRIRATELGLAEGVAHVARVTGRKVLAAFEERRPGRRPGPRRKP